jgi:low affinity Fe/Cu permease
MKLATGVEWFGSFGSRVSSFLSSFLHVACCMFSSLVWQGTEESHPFFFGVLSEFPRGLWRGIDSEMGYPR